MDMMLNSRQVRANCGGVSDMTLWRWLNSADFPQPVTVNRRRYWRADAVQAWWNNRAA